MTVLPFLPAQDRKASAAAPVPSTTAPATGTFWSPSGTMGSFSGSYRLERLVTEYGQLAAAGVFTGDLVDADGTAVGTGSRRHTAAAEATGDGTAWQVTVGPVDVNVLGFMVRMDEVTVRLSPDLPASGGSPGREAGPTPRTGR